MAATFAAIASIATAAPPLTPDGWGKLRIGMRESVAAKHLGLKIAPDDQVQSFECRQDELAGQPDMSVMAERGIITRIAIGGLSRLRTDRGFGVGSREADIRRAYGSALQVETAAYEEEPAHDLTFWAHGHNESRRGVRYGTDAKGRVQWLAVGTPSIGAMEGCL
jgi:hypothetical protein